MLRSKLLLFIISGALLFISCKDSGTDPNNGGGNGGENNGGEETPEETVDPTASINNPGNGAILEDEITFSVTGESENGFDKLHIYVDGEQVTIIDSPDFPYEYTLTTYNYNNGDHDLRAELDPTGEDTTVEASVPTTFKNYMVTLKTDGYINSLKESNDAAYMFISDPQGNVLREMELTAQSDGTFKLLPPEAISGDAPEHYTMTIGRKTTDYKGNDAFYLDTDAGLESWATINKSSSPSSSSSTSETTELQVTMDNFEQDPLYTNFWMENYPRYADAFAAGSDFHNGNASKTINIPKGSEDMVITHTPDYNNVSNPVPLYIWEKNPEDLGGSVSYDGTKDFTKMKSHTLSNTSGITVNYYTLWMTIAPNSFEKGDMYFDSRRPDRIGDANGSDSGLGLWVPDITDRSFLVSMNAVDKSNSNVSHTYQSAVMKGFPDEFHIVEAKVDVKNKSMDNLDLDITGSADYIRLNADASTNTHTQTWNLAIPDTTSSFVFPKIADSLDSSVNSYNRSDFIFTEVESVDYGKFDNGYDSYLEWQYGTKDFGEIIEWANRDEILNTSSSKVRSRAPRMRFKGKSSASASFTPFENKRAVREGAIPKRIR